MEGVHGSDLRLNKQLSRSGSQSPPAAQVHMIMFHRRRALSKVRNHSRQGQLNSTGQLHMSSQLMGCLMHSGLPPTCCCCCCCCYLLA
jgi:hypothetical protein